MSTTPSAAPSAAPSTTPPTTPSTASHTHLTPLMFLERSATIHPTQTAFVDGPRRITFAQFAADSQAFAAALLNHPDFQSGDRIGVLAPNSYEAILAQFAVALAGGVVVPLNTRLAPEELKYITGHASVHILLGEEELCKRACDRLPGVTHYILIADASGSFPHLDPDHPLRSCGKAESFADFISGYQDAPPLPYAVADENAPIALNYTSGTTGKPKGVVYTHRGAYLAALGGVVTHNLERSSSYLWTLPMFHCCGWATGWASMAASAKQVGIRAVRGNDIWRLINDENVTALCGAPAVLTTIVDSEEKRRVHNISVATAGAPPSPTIITRCENLGLEIVHVYGLTETYGPYTLCEAQQHWDTMTVRRRAVLKARQGVPTITNQQVRVVEQTPDDCPDLRDVPADGTTMGEVILRGNGVMAEYFNDPEATASAFRGGWFHTGDLGVMHEDGYIQLLDRAKDVIVSGGENISTIEVEQAIVAYPDVSDVAVIGVPDEKWGERPRAYVVLRPEAQGENPEDIAEVIIAHCRVHLAGYKIPRDIRVVDELPRTSTGKVQKKVLRDKAWENHELRVN